MSWLELIREYDARHGPHRSVPTNHGSRAGHDQETSVDEYESRSQTRLDTLSKMTALKILIGPKGTGNKFVGAEHTQDETKCQEMRKQFHNYLLDSRPPKCASIKSMRS